MTLTPLPANIALDSYFLEARSKLLDLAGILDRIERGGATSAVAGDPRLDRIRQALRVLTDSDVDRSATIQMVFSLPYEPGWKRPTPRT
jgi:hypothetical protein